MSYKDYIIKYDAGYGREVQVVGAESLEEAEQIAYEQWREEVGSQAYYEAVEYTEEEAEECGIELD